MALKQKNKKKTCTLFTVLICWTHKLCRQRLGNANTYHEMNFMIQQTDTRCFDFTQVSALSILYRMVHSSKLSICNQAQNVATFDQTNNKKNKSKFRFYSYLLHVCLAKCLRIVFKSRASKNVYICFDWHFCRWPAGTDLASECFRRQQYSYVDAAMKFARSRHWSMTAHFAQNRECKRVFYLFYCENMIILFNWIQNLKIWL